jgi:hypothetical protein
MVIDNDVSHLEAITSAFTQLGVGCLGIKYESGVTLNKDHFACVRVMVLDLHLTTGAKQTDDKTHFSLIAGMLEDNIAAEAGPYIIVLWTEYASKATELIAYLDQNLEPHARPLMVIPLSKTPHIDVDKKSVRDANLLRDELMEHILRSPQINALLSWESDVLRASSNTLSSILAIIPTAKRTNSLASGELDLILSQLAVAAVGKGHVSGDVRGAVNSVLAPVLLDRLNAMNSKEAELVWAKAVTKHSAAPMPDAGPAGLVNSMLHIESTGATPTAWGAVIDVPDGWKVDAKSKRIFGETLAAIMKDTIGIKEDDLASCAPVLIRIGAACDYAQNKKGTIPLLLGVKKPVGVRFKKAEALWVSPVFNKNGSVFEIVTHAGYITTQTQAVVRRMTSSFRFREQLLMELINKVSAHIARPGKVYLGKISNGN